MHEEDAEVVNHSLGDHLISGRTHTYDRDYLEAVQEAEKLIEKRQAKRRAARARKKKRKSEFRDYVEQLEHHRVADPPSDSNHS